jgi:hypothetical protein
LCVSLASGSQGIGALVGTAVVIALAPERMRRAWVIAVPALLSGFWYAEYGHQASETNLALWPTAFPYAMQSLSSALSALAGLTTLDTNPAGPISPSYGQPLAVGLLVVIGLSLWRGWRPPRMFWGVAVTLLALWVAAALSRNMGSRAPESSRYVPTNVALLLVGAAAALPRPRVGSRGGVLAAVALVAVAATNAGEFSTYRTTFSAVAAPSRAALGAVLVARGVAQPEFNPGIGPPTLLSNVHARAFFGAVASFGTNAYTPAELLRAPQRERERADHVLISAESLGLVPSGGANSRESSCRPAATPVTAISRVPPADVKIVAGSGEAVQVNLARFAVQPRKLAILAPGAAATLTLPADRAPTLPWRITVSTAARLCDI